MATLRLLGLVLLAVVAPLVRGDGCTPPFYRYGEICLNSVSTSTETWDEASVACKDLNGAASLAIIEDYRTQAHLVSLMETQTTNVYIGLKTTPTNPIYHWDNDVGKYLGSFTRWGVGQPDGFPVLTGKEYCVVMDNGNRKRPGRWYDVPCTEKLKYICSMPLDPNVDVDTPPPRPRCLGGEEWIGYTDKGCFYMANYPGNATSYTDAAQKCLDISENKATLATVLSGYEAALLEGIMYSHGVDAAWIGLSSTDNEFHWEIDYPIVFTNWGTNEPSGQSGEGCVAARVGGDNWDDTTCAKVLPFFCRVDSPPLRPPPTEVPPVGNCPGGWAEFGSYCYHVSTAETDWGEANFRCMQQHGSSLASISSDAEREFIYKEAIAKQGGPSDNAYLWIGLTRVQDAAGEWGSFGYVDGEELNYEFWGNGEPNGYGDNVVLLESCVAMSLSEAGVGAWTDEICQFSKWRYVCKVRRDSSYDDGACPGDTEDIWLQSGNSCYMPSSISGVANTPKTWTEAENICRANAGHLVSIENENEQILVRKLAFSFAVGYWIGLEQTGTNTFAWSDGTPYSYNQFPSGGPENVAGEEYCTALMIWEHGTWETAACGIKQPFICKRGKDDSKPIGPIVPHPTTGDCPKDYFKLGDICFYFLGYEENKQLTWEDAREECKKLNPKGTLATISNAGQQALLTSIIKVLPEGTDLWIGLNGIGVYDQYHWTDGSPLDYTSWMEGQPDNTVPIDDPSSQTCVVMMNNPDVPGEWNDVVCQIKRAYLCQADLGNHNEPPPDFPGDECKNSLYTPYFGTCLLLETKTRRSFDSAKSDCKSKEGNLLSPFDKYEMSFLIASLYTDGIPVNAEGWMGMKRNTATGQFEWIDGWPMVLTKWGKNEPNNNNGDCVVMTREGYMEVRDCSEKHEYYCEYPTDQKRPILPEPRGGDCINGYSPVPDTDYCIMYSTQQTLILQEEGDYRCARDYNGGRLPSIHSKAEEDYIVKKAKEYFTASDAKVWLGLERNQLGFNRWRDRSVLDYVNWIAGEPSTEKANSPGCVALQMNGGWSDIGCDKKAHFICQTPKLMKVVTDAPENSSDRPAAGLTALFLLSLAAAFFARL